MTEQSNMIAVKRDGPRGWHWIARESFDPAVHKLHQADALDHDGDGRKGGSLAVELDGSGDQLPPASNEARVHTSKPKPKRKVTK